MLVYSVINTKVSLKYEIEEIRYFTNTVNIDLAEHYLLGQIEILRYFICYVFVNIAFLIISILKK